MWRSFASSAPKDEDAKCYTFWQSMYENGDFISPEPLLVYGWLRHQSNENEITMTHWWDGEGKPLGPPEIVNHKPTKPWYATEAKWWRERQETRQLWGMNDVNTL